jgi:hypothetical protein
MTASSNAALWAESGKEAVGWLRVGEVGAVGAVGRGCWVPMSEAFLLQEIILTAERLIVVTNNRDPRIRAAMVLSLRATEMFPPMKVSVLWSMEGSIVTISEPVLETILTCQELAVV